MKFSFEKLIKIWHTKWLFGGILAFVAAVLALFLSGLTPFENLEFKTYDARFSLRGQQDVEQDNIAIVALDEDSFSGLKMNWPFPRSIIARAIINLYEAGAGLIIVDIDYTDPSQTQIAHDRNLAAAIKTTGIVVLAGGITQYASGSGETSYKYATPPFKMLTDTGAKWGFYNIDEDPDGFVRRYLLFQDVQQKVYFPLAIYAYAAVQNANNGTTRIISDDKGDFVIGNKRIPKVDFHSMLINFRGPAGTFPTFSLTDILDDEDYQLPNREEDSDVFEFYKLDETFKNKIVFIGAVAEVLHDNKFTPFFGYQGRKKKLPGVEIHANALSTLLRGDAISTQSQWIVIVTVFLLAALAMVATKWLKPFRGMFVVLGIILFYFIMAFYMFMNHLVWVQLTPPITAILLSFVGNVLHQTLTEQRERIRVKKSWQQYMSKDVIDNMLDSGELPKFGGERRELTVLFSDIRSFTTYSEKYPPHAVVERLNEYLTEMVDVIFRNDGTLDKFVGDEIMALFGAPHYDKQHAAKACITALEMMVRLRALQKDWASKKQEYFQIGIGINSGKMILGNLGSNQLLDYTVIGDDVNLGARLEGANKQYGTAIIISENTYRLVRKKAIVRELDSVRVKGKRRPVKIYELRGMAELPQIEKDLIVDVFTQGLFYYKELKWAQALTEFNRVLRYFPTDGPTRVYIKRCLDFIESPPPENWDGIYEFTTK